jgi:hypothetical protein
MIKIFQIIKLQENPEICDAYLALFITCCGAMVYLAWFGFLAAYDYLTF